MQTFLVLRAILNSLGGIPLFILRFANMHLRYPHCEPPHPVDTLTDRLNTLLNSSGPGYTLRLCPKQEYPITAPLRFAAPNQEISTASYPTDSSRAMLVVSGPIVNGTGHTTAVDGKCARCDGVKLRNIQINGTRLGGPLINGGGNIEMGGSNANQLIEYVRSFDPRGWTCLHVAQGNLSCTGVIVQNNDVGPAGSEAFHQWADGISVACRDSVVRNNKVNNPTDGGIVLFGSPGTRVENNAIWVETQTLLGGINLVDISPYGGDYRGVVVTNNTIAGGFASDVAQRSRTNGTNKYNAIIKVGIAIGPRTWFGDRYSNNVSTGGTVRDNQLTGAFSYGIAMRSATNFTVQGNVLIGNTSFIGRRGPNCTEDDIPSPAAFVIDSSTQDTSTTQPDFVPIATGDRLNLITCAVPPAGGDHWPLGWIGDPTTSFPGSLVPSWPGGRLLALAFPSGVFFIAVTCIVCIWWSLKRPLMAKYLCSRRSNDYVRLPKTG